MPLTLEPYLAQTSRWPADGRHVLAQHDEATIVVYQAYKPSIADEALSLGRFGPRWKRERMTWVKPGFFWMMYRSGWGTKPDQERVLGLRLRRSFFDEVLALAVHSSFVPEVYGSREAWAQAVERSPIRLQWDPDHGPSGQPLERRALQLGLSGEIAARFGESELLEVIDVTGLAHEQHQAFQRGGKEALVTPREDLYAVADPAVAARLGVSA